MSKTDSYGSRYVTVDGVRTHYIEAGDGDAVVLVHGAGPGASGETGWRNNISALAEHFRVLAIDMVGFGLTDKPSIEYSLEALKNHLAGFIRTLCLAPVRLVGNSVGAYVVTKCALDYPDLVKKVLMVSTANVARAMGIQVPPTVASADGIQALMAALENPNKETMKTWMSKIVHNADHITDALIESRVRLASLPGVKEAGRSLMTYMQTKLRDDPNHQQLYDLKSRLPRMTIPLSLIWGQKDTFAPIGYGYELRKMLPNMEFHVLENSAHQCQSDEIERFNELALNFLRK